MDPERFIHAGAKTLRQVHATATAIRQTPSAFVMENVMQMKIRTGSATTSKTASVGRVLFGALLSDCASVLAVIAQLTSTTMEAPEPLTCSFS